MKNLADKIAVITGGAAGIGKDLALECARAGMHVVLADVNEVGMREVARELSALGRRSLCVPTDVRSADAIQALLDRTLEEFGACHLMINNAGVFHAAPLVETSAAQYQRLIDINIGGVIHGCRIFGSHFVKQGSGHLVNTGSAAGVFPVPGMSAYSLTKFGVVGYSIQLRWELAAHGVGVTVIVPGTVRTDIALREGVGFKPEEVNKLMRGAPGTKRLAGRTVRAIARNRPIVHYGAEAHVLNIMRLAPMWLMDPIGKALGRWALDVLKSATIAPGAAAEASRPEDADGEHLT